MAIRPRNIALPVILVLGVAVVGVSLLPLWDRDGTLESLPVGSADSLPTEKAPGVASERESTTRAVVESPGQGDEIAVSAGDAPPATGPVSDGDNPGGPQSVGADRSPDEPEARGRSSDRRNVISGGSSGGSNRPVSSGSAAGGALTGGSSNPGTAAPAGAAGSEADPLTVFAEQPRAGAAGPQGTTPQPGSAQSDPTPVSEASDRLSGEVTEEEAASGEQPKAARTGQEKRDDTDAGTTAHVSMDVPATEFFIGDSIPIVVRIAAGTDVGHVPFHVAFNPGVVRFEYAEEGFFLGSDGNQTAFFAAPTSDGSAVVVGLSRLGRVEGVGGGGELCVLHFTATGPGDAALSFVRAKVRDSANRIVPSVFVSAPLSVRE